MPSTFVEPSERLIANGTIQHLVCFKFKVPTATNPIILPALQTLDRTSGEAIQGVDLIPSQTFTDLPSLVSAVQKAYFVEAKKVPYVLGFGGGTNVSHEGTSQAAPNGFGLRYDLCFSAQFSNENDRDFFVGNDNFPLKTDQHHHAFRNLVGPVIDGDSSATPAFGGNLLVFDYQQ